MAVVVISGGSDGMGRALAVALAARGDTVVAIGRRSTVPEISGITYLRADLSSVAEVRRVIAEIGSRWPVVDALLLFANAQSPRRMETAEGLEATFALYYLSRYLLSYGLTELMDRADHPLIVNVAGVGVTRGGVHWDDPQLTGKYSMITAQLQAGRANDLLGAGFVGKSRYVLYHPGFTRSGNLAPLPFLVRTLIRVAARFAAQPVADAIGPIRGWIDNPPSAQLTAIDRGRELPLDLPTLDPAAAARLTELTTTMLRDIPRPGPESSP
ncbi:SDR family NAD(P)-dependent oxidoreductase [Actinoplanes sp. HUAS TT8]|uniref:SDR family NAD(P)-dependent oxidoreductase n=1 Tax=Actinoplanes sp. HUAS TT8 TaxID=3447453 RepID=UPI003F521D9F